MVHPLPVMASRGSTTEPTLRIICLYRLCKIFVIIFPCAEFLLLCVVSLVQFAGVVLLGGFVFYDLLYYCQKSRGNFWIISCLKIFKVIKQYIFTQPSVGVVYH